MTPDGIVGSEWPSVRETCRRLGWGFDGWQDGAGMLILSLRADGEYAADTIVISLPRQVGKTYLIACIIFALCLMKPGLRVIWTAQVKDTALETFEKFLEMAARPTVKPHIERTPSGKGDEAIIFTNGSTIEFGARDSGFGRGRTDVDVLVLDEGQHLSTEALENMGAAQNVAKNPLTFVMGTPPRPRDKGEFFTIMRQEALGGDSDGTLYIETSADRGADPMDREQWRKANPSFPTRTSERAMLRLRKKLRNEESWAREALGIWDDLSHLPPFPGWGSPDLVKVGPDDDVPPTALALDMNHERLPALAAAWRGPDDVVHLELVPITGADDAELVEQVVTMAGRRIPVVIDSMSPAASLIPALRAAKVKVVSGTSGDMGKACGGMAGAIKGKRVTHAGQAELNKAIVGSKKRNIGTAGAWGIDRRDPESNIAPAVAAALAYYGAATAKKPTGRTIFA